MKRLGLKWISAGSALGLLAAGCSPKASKESHLQRANEYFAAQKFVEANLEYMNVLKLEPTNYTALRNIGIIYHEQGRTVQAFAVLSQVKSLRPEDVEARLHLGQTFQAGRKMPEAREEARFVLSKQPTNGAAMMLLADATTTTDEVQETFTELDKLRPMGDGTPGFHVARGSLLFREGKSAEAEIEFREALKLDPKFAGAHLGLGNLFWLGQDLVQAEQWLKTAAELSSSRSNARLRYAEFKIRNGDREAGRQMLEEMTKSVPDYLPAWLMLAEVAMGDRQYDRCQSLIEKILASDKINFDANMLQGRLAIARGDGTQALAVFEKLASIYEKVPQVHHQFALAKLLNKDVFGAMASLDKAVRLNPNLAESVLLLSELNVRQGNHTAAIIALNPLLKKFPKIYRGHMILATAYLGRGSREDAMKIYRDMMTLFPKNPQPALLLGGLELLNGNTNAARAMFEKSAAVAPDYLAASEQLIDLDLEAGLYERALALAKDQVAKNTNAAPPLLLLAKVHWAMTNFPPTEAALLKAIELDPSSRPAYVMLSRVYVKANRHKDALEKLEGLMEKNPRDVNALMLAAALYEQAKNYPAARNAYERLIEINPNAGVALNNLAYLYSEQFNEMDKAFEMARKAREVQPSDPATADTMGWILYKRGEYTWALSTLQESVENMRSPSAEVFYHLGMAHYAMGEEQPARDAFERARQLQGEFPAQADMERRLAYLNLDPITAPASAIPELETALQTNPSDPVILSRLAAIYERGGDIQKSVQTWEKALQQNPKNLNATVQLTRLYAEKLNNPDQALAMAKQARNLAPEDARVAHMVGRLVIEAGDHPWALSLLQESVRKLPKQPEVLFDLARAYYAVGRLQEAQSTMEQALQLNPEFSNAAQARLFLAMNDLYLNSGKAMGSADQITAALTSQPNFPPALMASALIQQQKGMATEARTGYEGLIRRFPLFAPARKQLAVLLVELKDYEGAFEQATKAREAYPRDPEVAKALGIVMYHRSDFKYANQLLAEAVSKLASDASAHFYLGMAQSKIDRKTESRASLSKALELDPNGTFAAEAKKMLAP